MPTFEYSLDAFTHVDEMYWCLKLILQGLTIPKAVEYMSKMKDICKKQRCQR